MGPQCTANTARGGLQVHCNAGVWTHKAQARMSSGGCSQHSMHCIQIVMPMVHPAVHRDMHRAPIHTQHCTRASPPRRGTAQLSAGAQVSTAAAPGRVLCRTGTQQTADSRQQTRSAQHLSRAHVTCTACSSAPLSGVIVDRRLRRAASKALRRVLLMHPLTHPQPTAARSTAWWTCDSRH